MYLENQEKWNLGEDRATWRLQKRTFNDSTSATAGSTKCVVMVSVVHACNMTRPFPGLFVTKQVDHHDTWVNLKILLGVA